MAKALALTFVLCLLGCPGQSAPAARAPAALAPGARVVHDDPALQRIQDESDADRARVQRRLDEMQAEADAEARRARSSGTMGG